MTDQPTARREPAPRSTEGKVTIANKTKHGETQSERKRGRGRPKGSKNKPKALINKEVAQDLLGVVKQTLPPELYEEMREAVRSGKNISTVNEAKILMKMMGPPIWQQLIMESESLGKKRESDIDPDLLDEIGPLPEEDADGLRKDLNERIKTYIQLMQFVNKMERDDDQSNNSEKPILEIFARRGVDGDRVKFLVGVESESVGGNADGTRRESVEPRTVSGEVSERQVNIQDSQQGETVRLLDHGGSGSDTQSSDTP